MLRLDGVRYIQRCTWLYALLQLNGSVDTLWMSLLNCVVKQEWWSRTVPSCIGSSKFWRVLFYFIVHGAMLHKDTWHNCIMCIEHASLHIPSCLPLPVSTLCSPSQCHFYVMCVTGWKSGELWGSGKGKEPLSAFCLKFLTCWELR